MIHKIALHIAVEKGYTEIVKLLLTKDDIDINDIFIILNQFAFIIFINRF